MKHHEFFSKYANLPISKRVMMVDFGCLGKSTFQDYFESIEKKNEQRRKLEVEIQGLINEVAPYLEGEK